jgi:hypothetical protein
MKKEKEVTILQPDRKFSV